MKSYYYFTLPILCILLVSCAGFPSRKWMDDTRNMDDKASRERIDQIANNFDQIDAKDREYAINTIAQNSTPVGQRGLLYTLNHEVIRKNIPLKNKVIGEIKKRPEEDTASKLLEISIKYTELLDENVVPFFQEKMGDQAAEPLTTSFQSKPAQLTPAVIDYLTDIDYKPARPVILTGLADNPELTDEEVGQYFIKNRDKMAPSSFYKSVEKKPEILLIKSVPELFLNYKYKEAAPHLLQNVQQNPEWVSGPLLEYFGSVKFQKSVELIKNNIEQNKLVESAIEALYLMDDYHLNLYILALSRDPDPKIRLTSLQKLALIKDEKIRSKAIPDFNRILDNHNKEQPEITLASIAFFNKAPYQTRTFELLKVVYKKNKDKAVRQKALEAMASMKNTSISRMQRLLTGNLRGSDVALLKKSTPRVVKRSTPKKKTTTKTSYKCSPNKKYPSNWITKLEKKLTTKFDQDMAAAIKKRLDNAIITYASSDNARASLINRAYQSSFKLDEESARDAMKMGIRYPGSLSAIVWQLNAEFKQDPMRFYTLSDIFGIERWKSEIIFQLVRKDCL